MSKSSEGSTLLDALLSDEAIVNVRTDSYGRKYVDIRGPIVRYDLNTGYGWCPSFNPKRSLHCERPKGHEGPHLAWDDPTTGQLYRDGYWE